MPKKDKSLGQVFTPSWIVETMLDDIGYQGPAILSSTIFEPGCGDGAFLVEIVSRLIAQARAENLSPEETSDILERAVHGAEIDADAHSACLERLDALAQEHGLPEVEWDVRQENLLALPPASYDYVAGNPPYVRTRLLSPETKALIRQTSHLSQRGMTELYLAFCEWGLRALAPHGRLSLLVPNSILGNDSAAAFRRYCVEKGLIKRLVNFDSATPFEVSTYVCIIECERGEDEEQGRTSAPVRISSWEKGTGFVERGVVDFSPDDVWRAPSVDDHAFLASCLTSPTIGDIATPATGIQLSGVSIFACPTPERLPGGLLRFNGHIIEEGITRPAVKTTTFQGGEPTDRVIFPYEHDENGRYRVMSEERVTRDFPLAYAYLSLHRDTLAARTLGDKKGAWFQYGRTQGFGTIDKWKLIVARDVPGERTEPLSPSIVGPGVVAYAGIMVCADERDAVERVACALATNEFLRYAQLVGKSIGNGYRQLGAKHLRVYGCSPI